MTVGKEVAVMCFLFNRHVALLRKQIQRPAILFFTSLTFAIVAPGPLWSDMGEAPIPTVAELVARDLEYLSIELDIVPELLDERTDGAALERLLAGTGVAITSDADAGQRRLLRQLVLLERLGRYDEILALPVSNKPASTEAQRLRGAELFLRFRVWSELAMRGRVRSKPMLGDILDWAPLSYFYAEAWTYACADFQGLGPIADIDDYEGIPSSIRAVHEIYFQKEMLYWVCRRHPLKIRTEIVLNNDGGSYASLNAEWFDVARRCDETESVKLECPELSAFERRIRDMPLSAVGEVGRRTVISSMLKWRGNLKSAIAEEEKKLRLLPDDSSARAEIACLKAQVLVDRGDPTAAYELLHRHRQLNAFSGRLPDCLAYVAGVLGKFDEMERVLWVVWPRGCENSSWCRKARGMLQRAKEQAGEKGTWAPNIMKWVKEDELSSGEDNKGEATATPTKPAE